MVRKAVLKSVGNLAVIDAPAIECGPDDVLVEVEVCGVCRTDRKAYAMGQRDLKLPRVLGHEIAGRVHTVGGRAAAAGWQPGDRVQVYPGQACGRCRYCQAGLNHLCDSMQIIGFHTDGGFSELLRIYIGGEEHAAASTEAARPTEAAKPTHSPAGQARQAAALTALPPLPAAPSPLNLLPDGLDARNASLAEPLACCINVLGRISLSDATTIAIFGAGPLGMLAAQLARSLGAGQVIMVEPMPVRRELAAQVSDTQLGFDSQTAEAILKLTGGLGADIAIACCPGNAAFEAALQATAKRGHVCFFSGLTDSQPLSSHALNSIHYRELTVLGSYGCSSADVTQALGLLAAGQAGIKGLPYLDISWPELPSNLASLEPANHVFTFFWPQYQP